MDGHQGGAPLTWNMLTMLASSMSVRQSLSKEEC